MVDNLSAEDQIERLKEEARSCTYPTDAATVKKRYKDTALILFKVCYLFVQENSTYSKFSGSSHEIQLSSHISSIWLWSKI